MSLEVELDMRVDPESEVTMSVEDGDEVSFGVAEAIVVKDHAILDNRDLPNQHPISAITGLAEALAESGKIDTVKVNGTALPVVNKAVDVPVPTTTSQLTNNSGFITESDIPVTSVNGMTGDVVVSGLPSATEDGTALVYVDGEWTNQTGYGYKKIELVPAWVGVVYDMTPYAAIIVSNEDGDMYVLESGSTYTIDVQGTEYSNLTAVSEAITFEGMELPITYIGNGSLVGGTGGDPACPFAFAYVNIPNFGLVENVAVINDTVLPDEEMNTTFTMMGDGIVTHPFSQEYLDLSSYMQKGVDYVTAGQMSGTTLGTKATAEGHDTTASGNYSHAEGSSTVASGSVSHAEGEFTTASGYYSHAEGAGTKATDYGSHAEGDSTTASSGGSHAEGTFSIAGGAHSHAEGWYSYAYGRSQHVFGENNIYESIPNSNPYERTTYVEIVGNGSSRNNRSNARTLDWSGNEVLAGTLTVGADPTANMQVATKQYVDNAIPTVPVTSVNGRTGAVTGLAEASSLATVATTGDYDDLIDKPTIPTNVSAFTNDAGYLVANDLTEATDADVIAIVV